MCTQFAVGHDKTLQIICNQHTNMQARTTVACIMQENYSRKICSKANAHNHNPAFHYSVDRCSMQPLIHKEPIISALHTTTLVSCASKQQLQSTYKIVSKSIHARQNYLRTHLTLYGFTTSVCIHPQAIRPQAIRPQALFVPGIRIGSNFARPSYSSTHASCSAVNWNLLPA